MLRTNRQIDKQTDSKILPKSTDIVGVGNNAIIAAREWMTRRRVRLIISYLCRWQLAIHDYSDIKQYDHSIYSTSWDYCAQNEKALVTESAIIRHLRRAVVRLCSREITVSPTYPYRTQYTCSAGLTHKHTKHVLMVPTVKGAPRTTLGES